MYVIIKFYILFLNFREGKPKGSAFFGSGSGEIWMDDMRCTGYESSLFDCPFPGWGIDNCGHSEDAGVICEEAEPEVLSNYHLYFYCSVKTSSHFESY